MTLIFEESRTGATVKEVGNNESKLIYTGELVDLEEEA